MNYIKDVIEEIDRRIQELQSIENEFRRKKNINGRLNAKTKREELEQFKNVILEKYLK